jgi:hypothetical protein
MRQLALLTAVCLLAGCGSATATHSQTTPPSTAASLAPTAACGSAIGATLGTVAERVYREAASGGDVAQAVHRVVSSTALASAVDAGDGATTRAALQGLLLNQIVAIEVLRGGRVLARAGAGPAIAPVRGSIPGTSATYVLSVQADRTYLQVVNQVTGAQVLLLGASASGSGAGGWRRLAGTIAGTLPAGSPTDGAVSVAGKSFQAHILTGAVYPSGTLHVALLTPSAAISCPGSLAQARVETLGHVGEAIYREELHSPDVAETVRHMEHASFFTSAVAAQDPAATRAAIVRFFREHIHVVRVRVTVGGHLLVDVGGPYVLAPVQGAVRSGRRVVGHFEMAIQDDAGYLKLAHLFTAAQVLMRVGPQQVMGTLSPGPAAVPDRGSVSYGGHTYEAYSFTGEAFPSGPLRISLLLGS